MTRKKIYTCFALLFCAPIALFSAQNQEWVLVGIEKTEGDQLDAIFATTSLTGKDVWEALGLGDATVYQDKIKNLLLYTNNGPNNNMTIWSEDIQNADEKKPLENIPSKNYVVVEDEKFSNAVEAWLDNQKKQGKTTNEDANKPLENRKIWFIKSKLGIRPQVHEMGVLIIKTKQEKTIALVEKGSLSDLTVKSIKQRIEEKENIEVALQKLLFNGKQLEDTHKLSHYNIQNGDTISLTQEQQQGINTDNNQNGDEPQQNETSDEALPLYTNPKIILIGSCMIVCAVYTIYTILNSKKIDNKTKGPHRAE